jgi:kynurenine 3-monooxygenase
MSLDTATLHIGETERGAWEDKKYDMVLVQMVLFPEFVHATPKHAVTGQTSAILPPSGTS